VATEGGSATENLLPVDPRAYKLSSLARVDDSALSFEERLGTLPSENPIAETLQPVAAPLEEGVLENRSETSAPSPVPSSWWEEHWRGMTGAALACLATASLVGVRRVVVRRLPERWWKQWRR
jgi:hypothetical protein